MPRRVVPAVVTLGLAIGAIVTSAQQAPAPAPPAGAAAQAAVQPAPPVTFRVEVNYVEVDVQVTDRSGNPVRDLRREDFEVFEDGKPQKVELFSVVDLPVERAERPLFASAPVEPDVQSNARQFDGRIYVILLDDLHTLATRSQLVKRAARQFIERHLGANDLAAVVHVSGRADAGQEFTANKRLLLAAVDKFMGRRLPSTTIARTEEYYRQQGIRQPGDRVNDPFDQERGFNARSAMETLRNVARFLDGVRGRRKALVLFSEGIDYDIYDVINNREASTVLDSVRDAISAATRANVAFYTVDPRGLATLGDESIEVGSFPDDPTLNIGISSLQNDLRLSQDSLRVLADETGGFAVVNTNDFPSAFDRLVRENSSYYVLGYYPTNDRRDGRFRKIEVKVARPGVEVRARKGYVAPKGRAPEATPAAAPAGASAAVRDALASPLSESGLSMNVQAAAFRGAGNTGSVLVAVEVDGRALRFTEQQGQFLETLEMAMQAVDASGNVKGGDRTSLELKLRPQTHAQVLATGVRYLRRLELPPGRYQLRVAGRSQGAALTGAVHYDLEVPEFAKAPFSMSGLVLTSVRAAVTPTARPDEQLKEVLPGPASTAREFGADDTLALFVEVYDNEAAKPHKVDISATLRADDGRVVFKHEDVRGSEEIQGARGGFGYATRIPLAGIEPGPYLLRVEARSRLSDDRAAVARETLIRVQPAPQANRPQPPAPSAPPPPGRVVVPVARGPQSGVPTYREVVARTEDEWAALWESLALRRPAPRVSFSNTMIAAVFLGERPTAGYAVEIVDVKADGAVLVVEYVERRPGDGVSGAQVLTTPFAVAGIPMHPGEVRFVRVEARPQ